MSFWTNAAKSALSSFAPSILKPAGERVGSEIAKEAALSVATSVAPNILLAGLGSALGPGTTEDKWDAFLGGGVVGSLAGLTGRGLSAGALGGLTGGRTAHLAAMELGAGAPGLQGGEQVMRFAGQHIPTVFDFGSDMVGGQLAIGELLKDNPSFRQPAPFFTGVEDYMLQQMYDDDPEGHRRAARAAVTAEAEQRERQRRRARSSPDDQDSNPYSQSFNALMRS